MNNEVYAENYGVDRMNNLKIVESNGETRENNNENG
jgi:hypothetical protein